jgi:DNA helicase-2/ATP-dependent DNA helicase PcrA
LSQLLPEVVADELALLARVSERLRARPERAGASEAPLLRELEGVREQLLSGAEQKDEAALRAQLQRQTALLRQLRGARGGPGVDPGSPYFAHLRLREGGQERDLCLGRATWIDGDVRIVDWRNAPISRVYYCYEQGDEYEERFAGQLRGGRVIARRTLSIRDAALERIEAPEGVFEPEPGRPERWRRLSRARPRLSGGEAAALRAHGRGALAGGRLGGAGAPSPQRLDRRLPEITGLIDAAQFELIARPAAGFLAIRGTAGSGKTTVALHRIACLAWADPGLDGPDTLFVLFSPALRRYVEHVLPALGVSRVAITTYRDWAAELRRRHFPALPLAQRDDAPAEVQRLKLHPAVGSALAEQVRRVRGPATAAQALDDWASALCDEALLREVTRREAPGAFRDAEIARCADWQRRRGEELFALLAGDREVEAALEPEDDPLLLRAWQLRVGPLRGRDRRPLRYRHLAIDEVQDFAPLEVRVLLDCLAEPKSLTLAGDTQQQVTPHCGSSWSGFLAGLGLPGTALETLRVSYRSSREIVGFAHALLGDLREDDLPPVATRSGPPVELFRFSDRGQCVAFLADALKELARREPLASVALLTPTRELSRVYHRGLEDALVPRVRRVADQDFTFLPGIEVTEIEQAKGLEFDYVVLLDVSGEHYPAGPRARRLLHVGATRAIHQLWLAAVGTPSPLVAGLAGPGSGPAAASGGHSTA